MFAVVVLLTKPREHCIVPEEYIFGLDELEDRLKTWGANKVHNHLIYWNRTLLNNDIAPDSILHPPNFNVDKCEIFPPPPQIDSVCFLGRIKRFFKSFENAKEFCSRFRPVLPVAYSSANLNKQPAPSNVAGEQLNEESDEEDKFVLPTVHMDSTDLVALDDIMTDDSVDNYTNDEQSDDSESINMDEEPNDQGENDGNENSKSQESDDDELDLESNLLTESLTDTEENNDTGNDAEFSATSNDNNLARNNNILLQSCENETVDLMENGQTRITQFFSDGMEMSYIYGQKLRIPKDPYQVKENDELSGNLPFKENQEKDRAYLVKMKDGHKEIMLKGRVVSWLIRMNEERNDKNYDKSYIKVLLIATFTVKFIKSGAGLEEGMLDFVKDLFIHRVQEDIVRLRSFENWITIASDEIRNSV